MPPFVDGSRTPDGPRRFFISHKPQRPPLPQNKALNAKESGACQIDAYVQAWKSMTAAVNIDPVAQLIGEHVKRIREQHNWTQDDVAERFDPPKHRQHISMWENGVRPRGFNLYQLADALGVKWTDLLKPIEPDE
jgi:DNA-binding transcriptional regulator YiaG